VGSKNALKKKTTFDESVPTSGQREGVKVGKGVGGRRRVGEATAGFAVISETLQNRRKLNIEGKE